MSFVVRLVLILICVDIVKSESDFNKTTNKDTFPLYNWTPEDKNKLLNNELSDSNNNVTNVTIFYDDVTKYNNVTTNYEDITNNYGNVTKKYGYLTDDSGTIDFIRYNKVRDKFDNKTMNILRVFKEAANLTFYKKSLDPSYDLGYNASEVNLEELILKWYLTYLNETRGDIFLPIKHENETNEQSGWILDNYIVSLIAKFTKESQSNLNYFMDRLQEINRALNAPGAALENDTRQLNAEVSNEEAVKGYKKVKKNLEKEAKEFEENLRDSDAVMMKHYKDLYKKKIDIYSLEQGTESKDPKLFDVEKKTDITPGIPEHPSSNQPEWDSGDKRTRYLNRSLTDTPILSGNPQSPSDMETNDLSNTNEATNNLGLDNISNTSNLESIGQNYVSHMEMQSPSSEKRLENIGIEISGDQLPRSPFEIASDPGNDIPGDKIPSNLGRKVKFNAKKYIFGNQYPGPPPEYDSKRYSGLGINAKWNPNDKRLDYRENLRRRSKEIDNSNVSHSNLIWHQLIHPEPYVEEQEFNPHDRNPLKPALYQDYSRRQNPGNSEAAVPVPTTETLSPMITETPSLTEIPLTIVTEFPSVASGGLSIPTKIATTLSTNNILPVSTEIPPSISIEVLPIISSGLPAIDTKTSFLTTEKPLIAMNNSLSTANETILSITTAISPNISQEIATEMVFLASKISLIGTDYSAPRAYKTPPSIAIKNFPTTPYKNTSVATDTQHLATDIPSVITDNYTTLATELPPSTAIEIYEVMSSKIPQIASDTSPLAAETPSIVIDNSMSITTATAPSIDSQTHRTISSEISSTTSDENLSLAYKSPSIENYNSPAMLNEFFLPIDTKILPIISNETPRLAKETPLIVTNNSLQLATESPLSITTKTPSTTSNENNSMVTEYQSLATEIPLIVFNKISQLATEALASIPTRINLTTYSEIPELSTETPLLATATPLIDTDNSLPIATKLTVSIATEISPIVSTETQPLPSEIPSIVINNSLPIVTEIATATSTEISTTVIQPQATEILSLATDKSAPIDTEISPTNTPDILPITIETQPLATKIPSIDIYNAPSIDSETLLLPAPNVTVEETTFSPPQFEESFIPIYIDTERNPPVLGTFPDPPLIPDTPNINTESNNTSIQDPYMSSLIVGENVMKTGITASEVTTENPFMRQLVDDMDASKNGYLSTFFVTLLDLIAKKNNEDVTPLMIEVEAAVNRYRLSIATTVQLLVSIVLSKNWLQLSRGQNRNFACHADVTGLDIPRENTSRLYQKHMADIRSPLAAELMKLARVLLTASPDVVKSQCSLLFNYMTNRRVTLSPRINELIDQADLLYRDREGIKLFESLQDIRDFPNITKTPQQIMMDMIDEAIAGPFRSGDTEKNLALLDTMNKALQEYFPTRRAKVAKPDKIYPIVKVFNTKFFNDIIMRNYKRNDKYSKKSIYTKVTHPKIYEKYLKYNKTHVTLKKMNKTVHIKHTTPDRLHYHRYELYLKKKRTSHHEDIKQSTKKLVYITKQNSENFDIIHNKQRKLAEKENKYSGIKFIPVTSFTNSEVIVKLKQTGHLISSKTQFIPSRMLQTTKLDYLNIRRNNTKDTSFHIKITRNKNTKKTIDEPINSLERMRLKKYLYKALKHSGRKFDKADENKEYLKTNNINHASSYSDEEEVLERNINKLFGFEPT